MKKSILYGIGAIIAAGIALFSILAIVYGFVFPTSKDSAVGTVICCGPVFLVFGLLALVCAFLAYKELKKEGEGEKAQKPEKEKSKK